MRNSRETLTLPKGDAKITIDELRIELLKLTFSHSRGAAEAVVQAKVLEAYVTGKPGTPADPFN